MALGPITIGETATIESQILAESRGVYVATPPGYEQGSQRYGVVYVLDAETQFQHTVASARFLGGFTNDLIPSLIVTGIANTNRMRDMTPPSPAAEGSLVPQGGADRFLRFAAAELMPWMDQRYWTSGYSVLIGHSLGECVDDARRGRLTRHEEEVDWSVQPFLRYSLRRVTLASSRSPPAK